MKRYSIALSVVMLASILFSSCGISDRSVPRETYDELQRQQEELQHELNRLREQKRAEILRKAQAYDAIIQFLSAQSPVELKSVSHLSPEEIGQGLVAASKLWSLVKATGDAELIASCQPQGEWQQVRCSSSYLKNYAEDKYSELMAEYNSQ